MKTAAVSATKRSGLFLLLLLSLAHFSNATEMPKQLAARVRFLENVDTWGGKDSLDRERFLQAFYWASSEFDSAASLDIRIIVVHCDKETGEFMHVGAYPVGIYYPNPGSKSPYEVWLVGKVTDQMIAVAFTNIYAKALNMTDKKAAAAIGQKVLNRLQSTVSVKELERK